MNNKKILLASLALIFLAVLIAGFASAQSNSVTISLFYDSTTGRNLTIMNGDVFGMVVSADSIFENSMTINLDLLDSNGNVVVNLLNVQTTSDSYFEHMYVSQAAYQGAGNFTIRGTVTGSPSGNTDTDELYFEARAPTPGNNPPTITSNPPATPINEGDSYSYDVDATDADNNTLTYSLMQNPGWLSVNPQTGLITGTAPAVNADSVFTATVQVSDGIDFDTQTFTITVLNIPVPANNPPMITSTPVTNVNEGQVYNYDANATDADNDALTYSLTQAPSWLSINSTTGLISGTAPFVSVDTNYNINIQVSDGRAGFANQSYVLTVVNIPGANNPPMITSSPVTQVNENATYNYQVIATDVDNDMLTYSLTQAPSWLSINSSTGLITGTAPEVNTDTPFNIIIEVSDGRAGFANQSYVLTVVNVPSEEEGKAAKKGGGFKLLPTDEFEGQKYLSQFIPRVISLEEEPEKPEAPKPATTLIWFLALIFFIAIVVVVLVLLRYK